MPFGQPGQRRNKATALLGAKPLQVFRYILVPALLPAWLTGFALAFARGMGEYGSVIFIAGNMPMKTEILPLLIMVKLDQYDYTGATAIGVLMLVVSFILLLLINLLLVVVGMILEGGAALIILIATWWVVRKEIRPIRNLARAATLLDSKREVPEVQVAAPSSRTTAQAVPPRASWFVVRWVVASALGAAAALALDALVPPGAIPFTATPARLVTNAHRVAPRGVVTRQSICWPVAVTTLPFSGKLSAASG